LVIPSHASTDFLIKKKRKKKKKINNDLAIFGCVMTREEEARKGEMTRI